MTDHERAMEAAAIALLVLRYPLADANTWQEMPQWIRDDRLREARTAIDAYHAALSPEPREPVETPTEADEGPFSVGGLAHDLGMLRPPCELCGYPMPKGEESFRHHGYSGPCPAPSPGTTEPSEVTWRNEARDVGGKLRVGPSSGQVEDWHPVPGKWIALWFPEFEAAVRSLLAVDRSLVSPPTPPKCHLYHLPAELFPVGDMVEAEMQERGWDRYGVAKRMGGDVVRNLATLDFILDVREEPDMILGLETARQLEAAFGVDTIVWVRLDEGYRVWRRWTQQPLSGVSLVSPPSEDPRLSRDDVERVLDCYAALELNPHDAPTAATVDAVLARLREAQNKGNER